MDNLLGITRRNWHNLLKENNYAVDFPFWPKALLLTMRSRFNSRLLKKERLNWHKKIENTKLKKDPIFILGHWRSGTTFLHNYMALDSQFAYPNLFEISNPHTFLELEGRVKQQLEKSANKNRPMDNVKINFDSPGEDAFAVGMMSLVSPLLGWNFPRRADYYDKYLTLEDVTRVEMERWQQSFLFFLKKLTLKYDKQLVLKSPSHTAIVKDLIKLFPSAKFIHIHRNPYKVFSSTKKLYRTAVRDSYLQKPNGNVENRILKQYDLLYSAFIRDIGSVPPEHFFELSYESLSQQPIKMLKSIYSHLGLEGFEQALPAFEKKALEDQNYKKNKFETLPPQVVERIQHKWEGYFDRWGYSKQITSSK